MGLENQSDIILEARNLYKSFKGFNAINDASIIINRDSIHGLIGPNGAGKTTFFNLLTGFLKPDKGQIWFNGINVTGNLPEALAQLGMIRSFQISSVFSKMTPLENVKIALLVKEKGYWEFWQSEKKMDRFNENALALLKQVGLSHYTKHISGSLPYGKKRALEIATTLAIEPSIMLLDEPTQGIGHEDLSSITDLIRKAAVGRTILMVEHNMKVVADLCDTITVMTRGSVLAQGSYEEISRNPEVREAYLGTSDEERHNT